jgi:hypothetical protein
MAHLIPFLYADQSLAELSVNVAGAAHSDAPGLATLLRAKSLYDAGSAAAATDLLAELIDRAVAPTRVRLWAAAALRERGLMPSGPGAELAQGIVMDVPVPGGRDVLAVYRDGTAHFVSRAGAAAVYDGGDPAKSALCAQIVAASERIVSASKGFSLPANLPKLTILTLSGPIVAGSQSPTEEPLRLGATLVAALARTNERA